MKIPLGNDALIYRGQTRVVLTRIRGNLQHYQRRISARMHEGSNRLVLSPDFLPLPDSAPLRDGRVSCPRLDSSQIKAEMPRTKTTI